MGPCLTKTYGSAGQDRLCKRRRFADVDAILQLLYWHTPAPYGLAEMGHLDSVPKGLLYKA